MTQELTDNTGEPATVEVVYGNPISSYTVSVIGAQSVGRADFVDSPDAKGERIFFHTEVDPDFGGRGLAGLLVREALAASIREGFTVVAVCPLFARHLVKHGDEFVAGGGRFRMPTQDDITQVARAAEDRAATPRP